ncbi:proteasome subunit beta type-2-like isoform X2 [Ostrinia furnacalis]|uniref:proteasome subunit beta type-2-like isoform X2 n=1 Tax=Ostrinia furnacalis TaxID=93504 RepID=UPI00103E735F|nr:proteasome subunit beta type-2-like isoform X2 [Ostrinia furnacalis]
MLPGQRQTKKTLSLCRFLKLPIDEKKLHTISDRLVMGLNGSTGDTLQFSQFVAKNVHLYKMRNGYKLDTAAVVHFTRKNLADALKSGNPCMVNMLVAGYDEHLGGMLYSLDFLAACVKVPFASHGCAGLFCLSILDRYYKPTLTEQEAYEVLKMCVREVHRRLFLNLPNFSVKVVSSHGVKKLPPINPATFVINK